MPKFNTRPELAFAAVPQPADPLESFGRALSLKSLLQQQRLGAMQQEQIRLELADQQKIREAFTEAQGEFDKTFELASQKGVSPAALLKLDAARLERRQKLAAATKEELETFIKQGEISGTAALAFKQMRAQNPEQAERAYQDFRPGLEKVLGRSLPEQLPDDATLDFVILSSAKSLQELRAQQERGEKKAEFETTLRGKQAEAELKQRDLAEREKFGVTLKEMSDFERRFVAENGRQPTVAELVAHKRDLAKAGRAGITIGGPVTQDEIDAYTDDFTSGRINPRDIDIRVRGKVLARARKQGLAALPTKVRETIELMDKAEGIIDIIEESYAKLERSAGPGALAAGTLDQVLARLQADPDAQMVRTQVGLLGNLARSISAERGVLTDRDVERAMQLLPQLTDRADVAKRKIEQLRRFAQNARAVAVKSVTSKFTRTGERIGDQAGESAPLTITLPSGKSITIK